MNNEGKIIAAVLAVTVLVVVGAAVINGRKSEPLSTAVPSVAALAVKGLTVSPQPFNLGDVPYKGGIVKFSFKMKNDTDLAMKLIRITTSCMCTQAAVKVGETKTDFFGMDMYGAGNPKISATIPAAAEGELLVAFDPAAHGPQGMGPFDRNIKLEFSDPAGYKDVVFNGSVVNN